MYKPSDKRQSVRVNFTSPEIKPPVDLWSALTRLLFFFRNYICTKFMQVLFALEIVTPNISFNLFTKFDKSFSGHTEVAAKLLIGKSALEMKPALLPIEFSLLR